MNAPQTLQDLDLDALVGEPIDRAQEAVEAAGGTVRRVAPGGAMTLDYRSNRVTLVVEDDRVVRSLGIG